ncbi:MAG: hypothetical protein M5R42_19675 [Rhodocyclaceae bacterium]|nr:hypothetical protein [Rhodocyclaceae bacterium]
MAESLPRRARFGLRQPRISQLTQHRRNSMRRLRAGTVLLAAPSSPARPEPFQRNCYISRKKLDRVAPSRYSGGATTRSARPIAQSCYDMRKAGSARSAWPS